MKDSELRGIVLKKYYDMRRRGYFQWAECTVEELGAEFGEIGADLMRICDQLSEHGLIEWKPARGVRGETIGGIGKITAFGADVVEGTAPSPITMSFRQHVVVSNSTNVQIGHDNTLSSQITLENLKTAIDHSTFSEAEKVEAKSRLGKLLEHPVVAAIIGGLASSLKPN